jgi:hypothetical protein
VRIAFVGSVLATAVVVATATTAGTAQPARHAATSCNASVVHYEQNRGAGQGLTELPWIAGGSGRRRIVGYLFYYSSVLGDRRVSQERGVVIPTGGAVPGGANAKILWVPPRGRPARWLLITGRRLDRPGSFRERLPIAGGPSFPSIVTVPRAGCWRLTLSSGATHATVVLRAVYPHPRGTCDPSPVHTEPNPALLDAPWIETTGGSPIYATGSIRDAGASEGATIFTGGRKILWVPEVPEAVGLSLTVIGLRLDAVGVFRQQFPVAYATSPPLGPVFPSIVDVPAPGCWLLTLRGARTAGIAVVRAVAPAAGG